MAVGLEALEMSRALGDARSMSRALARSWAFLDASQPSAREVARSTPATIVHAEPGTAEYMAALENLSSFAAVEGDTDAALEYLEQFTAMATGAQIVRSDLSHDDGVGVPCCSRR